MKGLYLVTPDWDDTDKLLAATEQGLLGGASLLQYRHKTAHDDLQQEQARALLALCRRYRVPFIINDHLALCAMLDADGIHVGGTDASVAAVRTLLGKDKIVGVSCYGDLDLARQSAAAGASYVAFGGFYPSRVKQYEVSTAPDIITRAKAEITLPICVIGGMNVHNSRPLVQLGANLVAAISSVYLAEDRQHAATEFAQLFA